jgi:YHS domain-containing protein
MLRVILLAILLLLVVRLFWRMIGAVIAGARSPRGNGHPAVRLVRDPVCGTYVRPSAALSLTTAGSTYYFCSEQCKTTYRRNADA